MKRLISFLMVLCILLSLTACKSKEERAVDYLNNNEYKKAYDLLYDLDEDHSQADDCLVRWCKYCLDNKTYDEALSEFKINKKENAEKVYRMIERYVNLIEASLGSSLVVVDDIYANKCDVALKVMNCIDTFYKDDADLNEIKDKMNNYITYADDNDKIQNYIDNNQYKEAYEYAYDLDEDHSRSDQLLFKWYEYCLDNEIVDNDLLAIDIGNKQNEIYEMIRTYLGKKVVPTAEQSKFILNYLHKLDDKFYNGENDFDFVILTLNNIIDNNKKIWDVPSWNSLPYDKYYASVHQYTEKDVNGYDLNFHAQSSGSGIIVHTYKKDGTFINGQYMLFGDFNMMDYCSIGNDHGFDGYWFYYVNRNEPAVYRININGEKEQILSSEDLDGNCVYKAFILDHDILYTYVENKDNEMIIYRVYMPDKKIEKYDTKVKNAGEFTLFIPEDSEHLRYHTDNQECIKKAEAIKNDKEEMYRLISKKLTVDKTIYDKQDADKIYNMYDNYICLAIAEENNLMPYCYFDYNIKTKELKMTLTNDTYVDPNK